MGNLSLWSVKSTQLGLSESGHDEKEKKQKLYSRIKFYKFSVTVLCYENRREEIKAA